jgi:hypothetical protein
MNRFQFLVGKGRESLPSPPHSPSLNDPHALLCNGHYVHSPGLKQPGPEVDHLLPSSAKFKNAWTYSTTPTKQFCGVGIN